MLFGGLTFYFAFKVIVIVLGKVGFVGYLLENTVVMMFWTISLLLLFSLCAA